MILVEADHLKLLFPRADGKKKHVFILLQKADKDRNFKQTDNAILLPTHDVSYKKQPLFHLQ